MFPDPLCSKSLVAQEAESDVGAEAEVLAKPKTRSEIDLRFRDSGKRGGAPTAPLSALSGDHEFTVVRFVVLCVVCIGNLAIGCFNY